MKVFGLILLILVFQLPFFSQTLPEWFRVHTEDDYIVELNTNYVMFSNQKTERVRFRWIYNFPQKLKDESAGQFKVILQEIQFNCRNETYRTYEIKWLDENDKVISQAKKKESGEWEQIEIGSIMNKLYPQACKLIDLRKREPAVEQ